MRATATTITAALVALALSGVATASTSTVPPTPISADEVDAARSGLVAYLADHPLPDPPLDPARQYDLGECPLVALADLQGVVDELGFTEPLLDFRAEPLAVRLAGIAPDIPGVTCAADVDGDSRDAGFGLYTDVIVVDLGDDDLVLDFYLLSAVGRGAAGMVEAPSLPGGKLYWSCSLDDELSACLAFWADEGFVVAVNLWSHEFEITQDAVITLLETVSPTAVAALTTYQPAPVVATTSADDAGDETVADVTAAKSGLERLVAGYVEPPAAAPPMPCPLVGVAEVDTAASRAGIDAPLGDWARGGGVTEVAGWESAADVLCSGQFAGNDPALGPEFQLHVLAVDAGDASAGDALVADLVGGPAGPPIAGASGAAPTVGRCDDGQAFDACVELVNLDGLVIGVAATDTAFLDRNAMAAVLQALAPAVVDHLARGATDVADPLAAIDPAAVAATAASVDQIVADSLDDDDDDVELDTCALLGAAELEAPLSAAGLAVDLATWSGAASRDPAPRVSCATDGQAVRIDAIAFADATAAADHVASVALPDGGSTSDLDPADVTVGSCQTVGGQEYCTEWWHSDRVAIGVTLLGEPAAIGPEDAATVLVSVVPVVVAGGTQLTVDGADVADAA